MRFPPPESANRAVGTSRGGEQNEPLRDQSRCACGPTGADCVRRGGDVRLRTAPSEMRRHEGDHAVDDTKVYRCSFEMKSEGLRTQAILRKRSMDACAVTR